MEWNGMEWSTCSHIFRYRIVYEILMKTNPM